MRKWTLVALLGVGVIIAYIDRTNLAIALASTEFKQYFALSDTGRGVLNSIFFWSYTAMQIPAGLIVDRFGVKRPLAISFVAWCLVGAATAMAGAFWELVALRLMLGVAEAALFLRAWLGWRNTSTSGNGVLRPAFSYRAANGGRRSPHLWRLG